MNQREQELQALIAQLETADTQEEAQALLQRAMEHTMKSISNRLPSIKRDRDIRKVIPK